MNLKPVNFSISANVASLFLSPSALLVLLSNKKAIHSFDFLKYITLSSSLNPDGTGLNFSGSSGINPPASGTIGIYIASCTSSNFTFPTAKYDLEIYSGSGACPFTVRLLEGNINLSKEVTR